MVTREEINTKPQGWLLQKLPFHAALNAMKGNVEASLPTDEKLTLIGAKRTCAPAYVVMVYYGKYTELTTR